MQSRLQALLTATRECSQRLLDVLQQENLALRAADAEDINRVTAAKRALINEMESYQRAQDNFLGSRNLPPGPAGMHRHLESLPAGAPEQDVWKNLQALVAQCRKRNEINGGILALGRQHVQQALHILKGSPETGTIYDRNGEALSATKTNPLAKA